MCRSNLIYDSLINTISSGMKIDSKKIILIVVSIASFIGPYTISSLNIALPTIGNQFAMDAISLGWLNTAFLLTTTVFILPFSGIADIYGRKRIFIYGMVIFLIGSILAALSTTGEILILSRFVQGLGSAILFATTVAIVTAAYPKEERGTAIGITIATVYAGLSLGPVLGGILIENFDWPAIFLLNIPLSLIVIIVTLVFIKDEWYGDEQSYDTHGVILFIIMMICFIFGLSSLPEIIGFICIILSIIVGFFFIKAENSTEWPLIRLSLLTKNRSFLFSNGAALLNYAMVFGVTFLLSLSLQYHREMTPTAAGLVLLAQPLIQMISSPFAGRLTDKVNPRFVATIGMLLSVIGIIFILITFESAPIEYLILALCILGLGFGLFSPSNTYAIMSSVKMSDYGIASAMTSTMRTLGQYFSMAISMIVFSLIIGNTEAIGESYKELSNCIMIILAIFILLGIPGIYASFMRGNLPTE